MKPAMLEETCEQAVQNGFPGRKKIVPKSSMNSAN
jgi:hypothetical protein